MRIKILLSILTAVSYFQNDAFSGCPPIKGFDETNTKNIHAADYFKNNILVDSDVKTRIESQKEKFWIDLFPAESYPFKGHHEKLIQLIDQYHHLDKSEKVLIPNRRRALKKIIDQSRHDLEKTKNDWTLQLILQTATSKREYLGELSFIGNGIQKMLFRMPGKQNAQVRHIENNYHYEVLQHMDPGGRSYESLKELLSLWTFCKQEAEFAPAPAESSKRYYPEFFLWLENPFFADFPFDTISRTDLFPDSRKVIFDEEGKAYSSEYGEPSGKTLTKDGTEYHPIRMLTYHYMIDENGSLYVRDRGYHSYVNRGKPALSAGMIKFEDYKISYIDNDSGHYKPKESHLTEAVKKLTEKYGDKIFSKTFTIDTEFKPFNRHLITSATELYHLAPLLSEEQKNVGIVYVTLDKMKSINEIILENKDLFEKAKIDLPKKDAKKLLKELEDIQSLTFGWNPETEKKVILGIVGYFESQFILQFQLELKGIEEQLNLRKKAIEKEDVGLNAKASRIDLESIHRALAYIKEVQDTMENLRHCSHQETPLMTSLVVSLNRLRSELSLDKITVRLGLSGTSSATSNLLEQLKKSTQGKISIFSDVNDLYSSYRIFQNIYFDRIAETSKVAINEFYFQLHRKKISIEEIRKIIHKLDERAQDIMDETELWDQLTTPLFAAPEYFKLMKEIAVKKEKAFTEARPSAHPAKKLKHRLRATDVIH